FLVVASAELAAVGKEQPARQTVARLAPIELKLNPPPEVLLVYVAQDIDRLDDAPQDCKCLGHPIRRRSVGEPLEHHVSAGHPVAQAGRDPNQLIPLFSE